MPWMQMTKAQMTTMGKGGAANHQKGQAAAKGKAKGKGKGTGKGQTQGKGKGPGGKGDAGAQGEQGKAFNCVHCGGYKNFGWRDYCQLCGRGRAKAIVEAPVRQQGDTQPAGGAGGGGDGLNAKDRKRLKFLELQEAKKNGSDSPTEMEQEEAPEVEPPKMHIPAFGMHTLPLLKDPMKAFALPAKAEWSKTPLEEVEEAKICKDTSASMELKAKMMRYQRYIDSEEEDDKDPAYQEMCHKLLKAAAEKLEKLGKGSKGAAAIEGMRGKLRAAAEAEERRLAELKEKEEKLEEKMDTMQEAFDLQIGEIVRRKEIFLAHRVMVAKQYADDAIARVARYQSIKAAWETKIAVESEETKNGKTTPAKGQDQAGGSASTAAPAADMPGEATADVVTEPAEVHSDYYLEAPWTSDQLPEPEKPEKGEYEFWINMAAAVHEWSGTHCSAPCTYENLTGPGDPEVQIKSIAKLIGMPYWITLYGNRLITKEDVVPRHLGFVLGQALIKPREAAMKELKGADKCSVEAKAKVKEALQNIKKKAKGGLVSKGNLK